MEFPTRIETFTVPRRSDSRTMPSIFGSIEATMSESRVATFRNRLLTVLTSTSIDNSPWLPDACPWPVMLCNTTKIPLVVEPISDVARPSGAKHELRLLWCRWRVCWWCWLCGRSSFWRWSGRWGFRTCCSRRYAVRWRYGGWRYGGWSLWCGST